MIYSFDAVLENYWKREKEKAANAAVLAAAFHLQPGLFRFVLILGVLVCPGT